MTRLSLGASWLALVLLHAACSGSPSTPAAPTPPVQPPPPPAEVPPAPIARLSVSIDRQINASAIQHVSSVTIDANGSSGTGLRYGLDFGDGQGVDLAYATHAYPNTGTYKVRVIVTDALGRTDQTSTDVIVKSIVGRWSHSFYNSNASRYESRTLNITLQNERSVSGAYTHPEGWTTPFTGEIIPRGATLILTDGTITFASDPGAGFDSTLTSMTVKVRGGSADGQTLTFSR